MTSYACKVSFCPSVEGVAHQDRTVFYEPDDDDVNVVLNQTEKNNKKKNSL